MPPDKYRVTQTRYLGDHLLAAAGETIYLYTGNDGGEARKESDRTGYLYVSVTKDPTGNSPHFTIQVAHLLKLNSPK